MTVYICNPETDVALATNSASYTPSRAIKEVRADFALLPALFARPGDVIAVADDLLGNAHLSSPVSSPNSSLLTSPDSFSDNSREALKRLAAESGILITNLGSLGKFVPGKITQIVPWGWNKALRNQLRHVGVDESLLPTAEYIDNLRILSDRSTVTQILSEAHQEVYGDTSGLFLPSTPIIARSAEELERAVNLFGKSVVKVPWSSSGRGVFFTDPSRFSQVSASLEGILRKQGALTVERFYEKKLDCATEWECHDGAVTFLGWSVFLTDAQGRFKYNYVGSEATLRYIIQENTPKCDLDKVLDFQKRILLHNFASNYEGVLGIDMMTLADGNLHPMIEINLRHTVGWLALQIERRIAEGMSPDVLNSISFMKYISSTLDYSDN